MGTTAHERDGERDQYITRVEALARLGVKAQTLYAYVSRGWIRSIRKPGGGKVSLYSRDDVEKLKARSSARTSHGVAAASAMRWGEPIIPTAITEITADGHRYRGRSAIEMARAGVPFESVAELLWSGMWFDEPVSWGAADFPKGMRDLLQLLPHIDLKSRVIELFALFTLYLSMSRRTSAQQMQTEAPVDAARELVQMMVALTGYIGPSRKPQDMHQGETVAQALLRNLGAIRAEENERAMDAILVLLADHELTGSTFAARIAASSGTFLHGCITAALTTHSGLYIARIHDRVEAFVAQGGNAQAMVNRVQEIQQTGVTPPGFNHPLYPRGDPRADYLLALAANRSKKPQKLTQLLKFLDLAKTRMHLYPRVEMGVVAVCNALRLPAGAPSVLFSIARTSGWVAHILEQRTAGFLVRPRAKYMSTGA